MPIYFMLYCPNAQMAHVQAAALLCDATPFCSEARPQGETKQETAGKLTL